MKKVLIAAVLALISLNASADIVLKRAMAAGTSGSGDDLLLEVKNITDLENCKLFAIGSAAGSMKVFVSLSGRIGTPVYQANQIYLYDGNAADEAVKVSSTAAGNVYWFVGPYTAIKVLQNGATNVTGGYLNCMA